MAKIVELESGTNPVEEVTDPKQKAKNETEEMIQRLRHMCLDCLLV